MPDRFSGYAKSFDAPASDGFQITPDDITELVEVTRGLYIGSAGTVVAVLASGNEVTLANIPSGTLLPMRVKQIKTTGTTAGLMVGLI